MSNKIPSIDEIKEMVGGIVGRRVTAKKSAKPVSETGVVVAEFKEADGNLAALLVVDHGFACRSGAALAMMPASVANESVKKKVLDGELMENFHEVANVLTAIFRAGEYRLILGKIHNEPTAELKPLMRKATKRLDMDMTIDGYGDGRAAILMTA